MAGIFQMGKLPNVHPILSTAQPIPTPSPAHTIPQSCPRVIYIHLMWDLRGSSFSQAAVIEQLESFYPQEIRTVQKTE